MDVCFPVYFDVFYFGQPTQAYFHTIRTVNYSIFSTTFAEPCQFHMADVRRQFYRRRTAAMILKWHSKIAVKILNKKVTRFFLAWEGGVSLRNVSISPTHGISNGHMLGAADFT